MNTTILLGDNRKTLPFLEPQSVHCIVTSPPYYGLRDYGHGEQIGLESSFYAYIDELVGVFRECRRVLRDDGVLWLNLGDSYVSSAGVSQPHRDASGGIGRGKNTRGTQGYASAGGGFRRPNSANELPSKNLLGIPWRVAFALQDDGWILRQDIIWHKPAPMPESVRDRCTKAHEYVFLLAKSARYYWDPEAMQEPSVDEEYIRRGKIRKTIDPLTVLTGDSGAVRYRANLHKQDGGRDTRNRRSVWSLGHTPYKGAHYATMPTTLAELCIRSTCPVDGLVLDPFGGAGTTGLVANQLDRNAILCELNPEYAELGKSRILQKCSDSKVCVLDPLDMPF